MFNNKLMPHRVYKEVTTTNKYNEIITKFVSTGFVEMFLSLNTRGSYLNNDTNISKYDFVAYAKEPVEKGSAIDAEYIVDFVLPCRNGYYLFLSNVKDVYTTVVEYDENTFSVAGISQTGNEQI